VSQLVRDCLGVQRFQELPKHQLPQELRHSQNCQQARVGQVDRQGQSLPGARLLRLPPAAQEHRHHLDCRALLQDLILQLLQQIQVHPEVLDFQLSQAVRLLPPRLLVQMVLDFLLDRSIQ